MLQLLCVVGLLRSVGNPIGSLLMAKARVDISFKFNVFKTFLFIPAIVIGGQMAGAIGVTLGFLLVQIINTILSYFVMIKPVLGSSYRQYILSLWLPFYLSLPTLVVSYALGIVLKGQLALGMLLAVQIAAGVLAFVVMIVLSRHPLVVEVKRQFCRSEKMKMLYGRGGRVASTGCRMRRKTPYVLSVPECRMRRPDKRVSVASDAGCGVKRLIHPTVLCSGPVGLIRRVSVASGTECRMRRKRLIRPTVLCSGLVGLIRRASVASGKNGNEHNKHSLTGIKFMRKK